ncbi:MAG: glycosyltransferase family 4 protein [Anaerolineaceae bacterium]|nr:glycosyltransferase family 4 protein [Anaerolineaceae bacterium]MDE0328351.1 glycosyltransferase family 4 protein [Anaerolineaceae bacterium]
MSDRPLRLLWFNLATDADAPNLGFTTEWINALAQHCEYIDVISMRVGRVDVAANVRVFSLGKERGFSEARRAFRFYRLLWALLRARRHDACFAHMQPLFAVMAAPLLRLHGVPLTLWYAHRAVTMRLRLAVMAATRVVSSSREGFRLSDGKLRITGQGIDVDRFTPADPAQGPFTLMSLGRIAPVKRLETLLSAAQLMAEHGARFKLRVLGTVYPQDRQYACDLRAQVNRDGLNDFVEFAGAVPHDQVPAELHRAHVMVNLSATGSIDKAVLEAMACGIPVVSANEAFVEMLSPWGGQLLAPPDDPKALAQRIQALMAMESCARVALGEELRSLVERDHSMQHLVENLVSVLRGGEPVA